MELRIRLPIPVLHCALLSRLHWPVLWFGILSACLYSALLPLWEGFDEAFHYAYVETLWTTKQLPVLGRTNIPVDIASSFRFAPASHVVHRWVAETTPFDEWFALPVAEKQNRRTALEQLRPEPVAASRPAYESHHPPLAYLALATADALMRGAPITARVLVLRILSSVTGIVLLYVGICGLVRALRLPEPYALAALFTALCSQMLYATIAHVANDWLAVGISAVLLAALVALVQFPGRRTAFRAALWLSAGLLTKAYFLVFLALAAGVAITLLWQRRFKVHDLWPAALLILLLDGPWYGRNVALYGNISGTHEQFDGIGFREAIAAAPRIHWLEAAAFMARGSLWTGNNSFTTFSRATLNLLLLLLACSIAIWLVRRRTAIQPGEWLLGATILLFSLAIAYATCAAFADTKGGVPGASPWYTQVLLAPVLALAYLGLARWPRVGAVLATLTILLWTWVYAATWVVKLFPLYSGGGAAPMRISDTVHWYRDQAAAHAADLSLTALASATWLYSGLVLCLLFCLALAAMVIGRLWTDVHHYNDR